MHQSSVSENSRLSRREAVGSPKSNPSTMSFCFEPAWAVCEADAVIVAGYEWVENGSVCLEMTNLRLTIKLSHLRNFLAFIAQLMHGTCFDASNPLRPLSLRRRSDRCLSAEDAPSSHLA